DSFYDFIEIGNKKDKDSKSLFSNYSRGLETNRDAWCYNYSKEELSQNIDKTLRFYNSEVDRFRKSLTDISVDNFIDFDAKKIS
ncbi:hypothetical protein OFN45_32315, partial [Escherichia coli]|nr:hypothetical protein [Escherichia coli]